MLSHYMATCHSPDEGFFWVAQLFTLLYHGSIHLQKTYSLADLNYCKNGSVPCAWKLKLAFGGTPVLPWRL